MQTSVEATHHSWDSSAEVEICPTCGVSHTKRCGYPFDFRLNIFRCAYCGNERICLDCYKSHPLTGEALCSNCFNFIKTLQQRTAPKAVRSQIEQWVKSAFESGQPLTMTGLCRKINEKESWCSCSQYHNQTQRSRGVPPSNYLVTMGKVRSALCRLEKQGEFVAYLGQIEDFGQLRGWDRMTLLFSMNHGIKIWFLVQRKHQQIRKRIQRQVLKTGETEVTIQEKIRQILLKSERLSIKDKRDLSRYLIKLLTLRIQLPEWDLDGLAAGTNRRKELTYALDRGMRRTGGYNIVGIRLFGRTLYYLNPRLILRNTEHHKLFGQEPTLMDYV